MKTPCLFVLTRLVNPCLAAFIAVALCACGTSGPYKAGSIQTATIGQDFKMDDQMNFITAEKLWLIGIGGGLGGVPGGLLAGAAATATQKKTGATLHSRIRQEFEKTLVEEINRTHLLTIVPGSRADGKVSVQVTNWGFTQNPFTGNMVTVFMAKVTITDTKGSKLWSCIVPGSNCKEIQQHTTPDRKKLESDPELVRAELSAVARMAARDVARVMKNGS